MRLKMSDIAVSTHSAIPRNFTRRCRLHASLFVLYPHLHTCTCPPWISHCLILLVSLPNMAFNNKIELRNHSGIGWFIPMQAVMESMAFADISLFDAILNDPHAKQPIPDPTTNVKATKGAHPPKLIQLSRNQLKDPSSVRSGYIVYVQLQTDPDKPTETVIRKVYESQTDALKAFQREYIMWITSIYPRQHTAEQLCRLNLKKYDERREDQNDRD